MDDSTGGCPIERCEQLFRETRLRASTGEIGLARLSEGTELVRIGRPLRPELAAWRYGTQLRRRRNRALPWSATGAAGVLEPRPRRYLPGLRSSARKPSPAE